MATRIPISQLAEIEIPRQALEKANKAPAMRGEHVFNNSLLKLIPSIVTEFIQQSFHGNTFNTLVQSGALRANSQVVDACNNPVPPLYKEAVCHELVVHVHGDYTDENAIAYGKKIRIIKETVVDYLKRINDALDNPDGVRFNAQEKYIEELIEEFISNEYYVDKTALNIWLKKGGKVQRYKEVKTEVVKMLRLLGYHHNNGEMFDWVKEIRRAISGGLNAACVTVLYTR